MAIHSHLPGQQARQRKEKQSSPKLLFVAFDGTWHGSVKSSKETVVSSLPDLISKSEHIRKIRVNGVGTDGLTDKILGGLGGWGTRRNVITAYRNIADDYNKGDRIIFCGYSRGAWAARYLAMIIDCLGLVRDGDTEFFKRLYDVSKKDPYLAKANKDELRLSYDFWDDIQIDALCCFDTVGSLGIPLFGIAKPLSYLHRSKHKTKVIDHVPNNVKYSFHALALHETRSPYSPTYMCGHNVHQVFFLGDHGNMGKLGQQEGLVHAPLAWMVQQLHSHLGVSFDEDRLKRRFPSCTPEGQPGSMSRQDTHDTTHETMMKHAWCCPSGSIPGAGVGRLVIMGRKDRNPGMVLNYCDADCNDSGTDESTQRETASAHAQVHIGARGRQECGFTDAVPGYLGVQPMDPKQVFFWKRIATGEQEVVAADVIQEAKVGFLEARLLGLPAAAARHPECCGLNQIREEEVDAEVPAENEETWDSDVKQDQVSQDLKPCLKIVSNSLKPNCLLAISATSPLPTEEEYDESNEESDEESDQENDEESDQEGDKESVPDLVENTGETSAEKLVAELPPPPFKCQDCDEAFYYTAALGEHQEMFAHGPMSAREKKPERAAGPSAPEFKCKDCGEAFHHFTMLLEHQEKAGHGPFIKPVEKPVEQPAEKPAAAPEFKCRDCHEAFYHFTVLLEHQEEAGHGSWAAEKNKAVEKPVEKPAEKPTIEDKAGEVSVSVYKCTDCGRLYRDVNSFQTHLAWNHGRRSTYPNKYLTKVTPEEAVAPAKKVTSRFRCKPCNEPFRSQYLLARHWRKTHEDAWCALFDKDNISDESISYSDFQDFDNYDEDDMLDDLRQINSWSSNKKNMVPCITCWKKFKTTSQMVEHVEMRECHSYIAAHSIKWAVRRSDQSVVSGCYSDGKFQCPDGEVRFDSLSSLLRHAEGTKWCADVAQGPIKAFMTEVKWRMIEGELF